MKDLVVQARFCKLTAKCEFSFGIFYGFTFKLS